MTALFGVRRILEPEQTFLYLCLHDGGMLDMPDLCKNLEVKKPTATNFINLLEATHLIHRLAPHGYGKEILRARYKIYMADAAISASVLLKGKSMLEDQAALGRAVETAFFKHVFTRHFNAGIGFSYWRGKKDDDVDIVAQVQGRTIPFEVKYRYQNTGLGELKGLNSFCI
jgi:predicted AAA+ superfamily ATPase